MVFTFYNLCESLWGGFPAVESVSTGLDSADVQDKAESMTEVLSERDEQEEGSSLSEHFKVIQNISQKFDAFFSHQLHCYLHHDMLTELAESLHQISGPLLPSS